MEEKINEKLNIPSIISYENEDKIIYNEVDGNEDYVLLEVENNNFGIFDQYSDRSAKEYFPKFLFENNKEYFVLTNQELDILNNSFSNLEYYY